MPTMLNELIAIGFTSCSADILRYIPPNKFIPLSHSRLSVIIPSRRYISCRKTSTKVQNPQQCIVIKTNSKGLGAVVGSGRHR